MPSRRLTEIALVAVAMLGGALVFTWPLAADPSRTLPAPGDSLYNAWVMGWVAERTAHGLSGVWDTPIFFPYRATLAFAEPMFGIAVPLAPAYWLGANAVLLHNLAVWGSFLVAGTGGYALGRDLTGSRSAGAVCGTVAAFIPYRLGHLPHVQVLMAGWLWWTAWSVHRYFDTPSLVRALRTAVFYILLGLSSLYWAYVGLVPIALIAVVEVWRRRGPVRTWIVHGLAAAALCAAAFAPVAGPLRSLTTEGSPVAGTVDRRSYSADVLSYVSGQPTSIVWGSVLRRGDGEADLFPGLTVLICAALALALRRSAGSRSDAVRPGVWTGVYAALVVAGIVLSLGPTPAYGGRVLFANPLFAWLSAAVPGFAQLRASARFVVIAQLGLSVIAAYGVAVWLAGRQRQKHAALAGAIVAGLVFLEGLALPVGVFAFSPYQRSGDRSTVYWLSQRPGGAIVEQPLDGWGPIDYSMVYQHRTLLHGHPIVSGVSRFSPPLPAMLADPASPLVAPDRVPEAVRFLRALGVRFVVVHNVWFANRGLGEAIRTAYIDASGRPPVPFGESVIVDLGPVAAPPAAEPARELPPASLQVSATSGNVERMVDGDPATRWLTGRPQSGAERIDVALGRGQAVSGVRLQLMGRSLNDYPRGLTVSVSPDGEHFADVFSGSVFPQLGAALRLDPVAPTIELRWPATPAVHVRLQQTGTTRTWFWSVHELRVLTPPA